MSTIILDKMKKMWMMWMMLSLTNHNKQWYNGCSLITPWKILMSTEYSAVVAYGKWVNNIEDAAQHMIERKVINEDEVQDFIDDFEIDGIQFITDDEGGGILGMIIDIQTLYHSANEVKVNCDKLNALIGGCDIHQFVYSF